MRAKHILIDSSYASIWRDLMEGVALFVREARQRWQLHCVTAADFPAALAQPPHGILPVLVPQKSALSQAIRDARIPAVKLFRSAHQFLTSVTTDNPGIGVRIAESFVEREYQHFACVVVDRPWRAP